MILIITCPSCGNSSRNDEAKIPAGRLNTVCNQCKARFVLNKEQGLNCKRENPDLDNNQYDNDDWLVDAVLCQGMTYDIAGVGQLITSGLIKEDTRVRPPNQEMYLPASQFVQLRKFFEKAEDERRKHGA